MSYAFVPGPAEALLVVSAPVPLPDKPPVDAVIVGIVTDTFTLDEPPEAVARPMPPTEVDVEFVVADEFDDVPMLFRLEPPPWPMPIELEPDTEPDDESAVVSALAACAAQSAMAHARCKIVLFTFVLPKPFFTTNEAACK